MTKGRIYVAGRYRPFFPEKTILTSENVREQIALNIAVAQHAGMLIAEKGYYPVIPHNFTIGFDATQSDQLWLEGSLEEMLTCDGVYMLQGWTESSGARNEALEAEAANIPVYYDLRELS
jgi:hypothetical protein|tara:strand:- start:707 stop:1066 length:360 start_codon:yes stop_codon:yes gene_type:complete